MPSSLGKGWHCCVLMYTHVESAVLSLVSQMYSRMIARKVWPVMC